MPFSRNCIPTFLRIEIVSVNVGKIISYSDCYSDFLDDRNLFRKCRKNYSLFPELYSDFLDNRNLFWKSRKTYSLCPELYSDFLGLKFFLYFISSLSLTVSSPPLRWPLIPYHSLLLTLPSISFPPLPFDPIPFPSSPIPFPSSPIPFPSSPKQKQTEPSWIRQSEQHSWSYFYYLHLYIKIFFL